MDSESKQTFGKWRVKTKMALFHSQILALHFIISVRKRVSIPKLLQHKNPSQGCTVNLRQPSAKRRVKTKMTFSHGQTFAVHFIISVRKRVSIPELLQHKNPSQGCTVNLRQPSTKRRVKTKMTLFTAKYSPFTSSFQ